MEDIIEINGVKYRKIEEEQKPTGWERAETYHILWNDGTGIAENFAVFDGNDKLDNGRYKVGMYFSNIELAKNMTRAVSLFLRMNRFAAENQKTKIDLFDPKCDVFIIDYKNYTCCDFSAIAVCPVSDIISPFQVYFDSRETAEAAIEEFREDLIWYFTEFENTMRF